LGDVLRLNSAISSDDFNIDKLIPLLSAVANSQISLKAIAILVVLELVQNFVAVTSIASVAFPSHDESGALIAPSYKVTRLLVPVLGNPKPRDVMAQGF
jgi:hypothetical protein